MLTPLEIGIFRAFGYVVLRQCLSTAEVAELDAAYRRVMAAAPPYDYFGANGTKLALFFVESDPAFTRLALHPKILAALREGLGTEPLLLASDMWANMDDTPWHSDGTPGQMGPSVKVTTYLDRMTREQGALRVVPGSHHPEFCAAIINRCGFWDQGRPRLKVAQDDVPGQVIVETAPGDVMIWDNRMWHSAPRRADGKPRRGLFMSFVPDPGDECIPVADVRQNVGIILSAHRKHLYGKGFFEFGGTEAERMAARLETIADRSLRE